ncbi:hypothetical protein QCA50_000976 [Cerrena zonata]|uniref:Uncharacterized protein n=1 Tax=Cerrena zonata TaxID=2478898 RepID=A0AAW0GUA0_9APHY
MSIPHDLFQGSIPTSHRADLLYCQWRIASAVNAFPRDHHDLPLARQRWLIGLFHEVLNLKQAIATAMLGGCTGGLFFEQDYSWLRSEPGAQFSIHWDRLPSSVKPHLDAISSFQELRRRGGVSPWWEYNENLPYTKCPKWWHVSEAEVGVRLFLHFARYSAFAVNFLKILRQSALKCFTNF